MAILHGMRSGALRLWLIGLLAAAAVISVIGNKTSSPFIGWLSFACFIGALFLYLSWRRTVLAERRARAFDRRAADDETRPRADQ
ncbi:MAG: hypothetical protein ACRDM1_08135 [Gaiellaceae bacterium]